MDLFILFQEACNIWWNHANLLCPGFQLKFWKKKKNISGLKNKYRMIFFVFCSYYWFSFHLQFYFYCVNWMQGWFIAGMWYNWFEDFFFHSDFGLFHFHQCRIVFFRFYVDSSHCYQPGFFNNCLYCCYKNGHKPCRV